MCAAHEWVATLFWSWVTYFLNRNLSISYRIYYIDKKNAAWSWGTYILYRWKNVLIQIKYTMNLIALYYVWGVGISLQKTVKPYETVKGMQM